jgi:hypothetical protein
VSESSGDGQRPLGQEAEANSARGYLDICPDSVTPALLSVEAGDVLDVNGALYRVTGKTPGENGAVNFELEPWNAG